MEFNTALDTARYFATSHYPVCTVFHQVAFTRYQVLFQYLLGQISEQSRAENAPLECRPLIGWREKEEDDEGEKERRADRGRETERERGATMSH